MPMTVLPSQWLLLVAGTIGGLYSSQGFAGGTDPVSPSASTTEPSESRLAPYANDPNHLWNRLHQGLFLRVASDGSRVIHSADPLLFQGGTFLLEDEPHKRALSLLDELLSESKDQSIKDPLQRMFLQRDLWAAFDYLAWYPDDWVNHSRNEPAAIALRTRLSRAIGRLALSDAEVDELPDNYALALKSRQYPTAHDLEYPERSFLPPDLFDPSGPWVQFHQSTGTPMAQKHFEGAGGRALHLIFLRLPEGKAATVKHLKELKGDPIKQFPIGTMVCMVRRALALDQSAKLRVTPVTELVQLRVYRRIPADHRANFKGDFGEQDAYEFVLDRKTLFAARHGLRSVGPTDPAEPFGRSVAERIDFERSGGRAETQLKSCIQCHQAPGVFSVTSLQRGLREKDAGEFFRINELPMEIKYTLQAKSKQFNWGLLQGMLELQRNDDDVRFPSGNRAGPE